MDEETYRVFLSGVCGKQSCADMSERQLAAVLRAMRQAGFGQKPLRVQPIETGLATRRQLEYIKGMWAACARHTSDAALRAFVKRIAGVDALRFLDIALAQKVILALRDMMTKAGIDPDAPEETRG